MHVAVLRPTTLENLPASQLTHEDEPLITLNFPASQLVHFEDPTSLTVPSAHNVQVAAVRPTTLEYLPASQLTHEDELLTTLYVPASQIVHEEEPLTLKVLLGRWCTSVQEVQLRLNTCQGGMHQCTLPC